MRIFWLFLSLLATVEGLDTIGRVVAVEGELTAVNQNTKRNLSLNSDVYLGDLLLTGESSTGQVQFTDGMLILLIPGSAYSVDTYSKSLISSKNRFIAKLREGGVRVTTGLIAQKNPENFELNTPNATIGVRGTVFEARVFNGAVFASCSTGVIVLTNQGGTLLLGPAASAQFAMVSSKRSPPQALKTRPDALDASFFELPPGGISQEQKTTGASIKKGC